MRKLQLERPIAFLDLETTTADKNTARIVEFCIVKLFPNGSKDKKTRFIYPEMDIPEESTKIHGITNEDVKAMPTFRQIAKALLKFLDGCDLGGYNSNNFDIPVLVNEFARAGYDFDYRSRSLVDVCNIFKIKEKRTLGAASEFYLGKPLQDAHTAEADVIATVDVFNAQLKKYTDLPLTVKELANFSSFGKELIDINGKFERDRDGDIIFSFGKHKGMKCKYQKDYLQFMLNGDFTEDVKQIVRLLLVDQKV